MRLLWSIALFLPLLGAAPQRDMYVAPDSDRRVALVIGNDDYANPAWKLRNAVNDANDLAAELRGLGFEVTKKLNLDLEATERAIDGFAGGIRPGDVALFHYSGHGIQVGGENYLVPTDFNASDETGAKYDSYSASELQERLENSGARLNIIVLDACRNNPFRTTRGGSRGLAAMNAGRGTFIAFATAAGQTADDNREGQNGLFTTHLLETLREEGLDLNRVFDRVRERVYQASNGKQTPWSTTSVIGEFYFRLQINPRQPAPAGDTALQVELAYWNSIKDSANPAAFENYLREYPSGKFASIARLKVAELRPAASTAPSRRQEPTPTEVARVRPPSPSPPAAIGRRPRAGDVVTNEKDGLRYVWIPPGSFEMGCSPGDNECDGDENPRHGVRISRGFWMGQTEVTVAAYERFAGATGRKMPPAPSFNRGWANKDHPIVNVTWNDAKAYCEWAGGRLPTEAEWEYAARAGDTRTRYGEIDTIAWSADNSGNRPLDSARLWREKRSEYSKTLSENVNRTHTAAEKEPNAWGLYDVLGNVWEWCDDWFDSAYYKHSPSTDPEGPSSGNFRVLRGGSWFVNPTFVRLSNRNRLLPDNWSNSSGCVAPGTRTLEA